MSDQQTNTMMVPRGGIEPSLIQLKVHHFLNGEFPVYLPVEAGGCDPIPPLR
jgi:hypothetical protein